MAIQRRRDQYLYTIVFLGDTRYEGGQVAFQMHARGEEVGDNDEAVDAPGDQQIGSLFQAGTAERWRAA